MIHFAPEVNNLKIVAFRAGFTNGEIPAQTQGKETPIMREYEVIFILHPDLDENTINDSITKVKTWITDADGSIVKEDIWGKKRLAYEIQKQREGFYVLLHTQMEPTFIHELENSMKLMEPVMRYIVTKVE